MNRKMNRKIMLAFCLALVLALSPLSVCASAHDAIRWTAADTAGGGVLTGYAGVLPETLVIPDTVDGVRIEIIEDRLFMNCGTIREVRLPDSVFMIGYAAFAGCDQLETVTSDAGVSFLASCAFEDCVRLKQAPKCCDGVGSSAFRDCKLLQTVDLSGAFSIADKAFAGCTSLRTVTMSAQAIGDDAFDRCTALRTVYDMRYLHEYDPYYALTEGWSDKGNDAFFNAEHIRVHYVQKDWEDRLITHELHSREALNVTVGRGMLPGETCFWWLDDETTPDVVGCETGSDGLRGDVLQIGGNQPGTAWVKVEVVDAQGNVVYMETHRIDVTLTTAQTILRFLRTQIPGLYRLLHRLFPERVY